VIDSRPPPPPVTTIPPPRLVTSAARSRLSCVPTKSKTAGHSPRFEQHPSALDGVQRRHGGVGERRGVDRIDVTDRDEAARGHHDVVGHAAVSSAAARPGTTSRHTLSSPREHAEHPPQPSSS
jgi:hypothetical protein